MTSSSDPNPSNASNAPLVSTKRELRKLSSNTQATAAELKAFLAELKGRSPQEMLGIVAASQLVRSLVLSTILVAVLILVFTLIPYFRSDQSALATEAPLKEAQVTQPAQATKPETPAPEDTAKTKPPTDTEPTQTDISPLGVSEQKEAPSNVNPLDSDRGNFLDGLE